uniref:E3 ubiquitin-protein ligase MARCHF2 n=1 Tax=Hippocampus comes TaxID=109280 RepID=A0A3Q2X7U6_HIPCM
MTTGGCHQPDTLCHCANDTHVQTSDSTHFKSVSRFSSAVGRIVASSQNKKRKRGLVHPRSVLLIDRRAARALVCSDGPICRICHEGGCAEVLLSPCDCTGTLATVHKSCLELWLASSNTNCCELCNARFSIQRRLRPFTEWLQDPGSYEERRLVFCDIVCFLFVTPLATISGWLCLKGVKDDLQLGSLLQNTGLISLTLVLFTIYSLWTMVCLRFHCKLYSEWRRKDQKVHLIIPKAKEVVCSQHALLSTTSIHMPSDDSLV